MGRILEALKQGAPPRPPVAAPLLTLPLPIEKHETPETRVEVIPTPATTASVEEIPFIEVGGPGRAIEGSPAVLEAPIGFWRVGGRRKKATAVTGSDAPAGTDVVSLTFRALATARPEERFGRELVAFHDAAHPLAEQYRVLWANLSGALTKQTSQLLLFAGVGTVTCKTTVVLNLAITCAREEKRTLAVELTAVPPSVGRRLGLPERPGLADVVSGRASLHDAIQETGLANFQILTAGQSPAPLAAEAVEGVLHQLRSKFDLVLIDGPTWETEPEGFGLTGVDAIYAVVRQIEAQSPAIDGTLRRIAQRGARLAGCVLTAP